MQPLTPLAAGAIVALAGAAFAQTWSQTPGPAGSFITALGVSGSDTLAGTDVGRVFLSMNGGGAWGEVTANLPPGSVQAIASLDGNIYVGKRSAGLFRSADRGRHWTNISAGLSSPDVLAVVSHNGALFALVQTAFSDDLFRSTDTGLTWARLPAPNAFISLFSGGQTLYAGAAFGVFRSTDDGQHWTGPSNGLAPIDVTTVQGTGGALVVLASNQLMRSTDDGGSFTTADVGLPAGYAATALGSQGTGLFAGVQNVLTGVFGLFRSTDAGLSWQRADDGLPGGVDRIARSFAASGGVMLVGTSSGLFRTADGGGAWVDSASGLLAATATHLSGAGGVLFASVENSGRVFRTTDSGATWTAGQNGITTGAVLLTVTATPSAVFAGTAFGGIFRSTDAGVTFGPVNTGVPRFNSDIGLQFRQIAAITPHAGALFAGTGAGIQVTNSFSQLSGGGMLKSTDGGSSWQMINTGFPIIDQTPPPASQPILDPVTALLDGGPYLLAATLASGLQRTTDAGAHWAPSNTGLPLNFAGRPPTVSALTLRGSTAFIATTGFSFGGEGGTGVFRSEDAGQSWTRSDSGLPAGRAVNGIAAVGAVLYATTGNALNPLPDDGVYSSADGGVTWSLTSLSGLACSPVAGLDGTPFVGAPGAGVWRQASSCYANCDGSTSPPILNVADFVCFLNKFAAGDSYANCDNSTTPPVLNVSDFVCFQGRFASGCE